MHGLRFWMVISLFVNLAGFVWAAEQPEDLPRIGDSVTILLVDGSKTLNGTLLAQTDSSVRVETASGIQEIPRKQIQYFSRSGERPSQRQAGFVEDEPSGRRAPAEGAGNEGSRKDAAPPRGKGAGDGGDKLLELLRNSPAPAAASEGVEQVTDRYAWAQNQVVRGAFETAAYTLRKLVTSGEAETIKKAEARCRERYQTSLADLMVICYAQSPCKMCKGIGMSLCPKCTGQGYTERWKLVPTGDMGLVKPGTREIDTGSMDNFGTVFEGVNSKQIRQVSICDLCRGHGFEPCTTCRGTRSILWTPTEYERRNYGQFLIQQGDQCLAGSERGFADTLREMPSAGFAGGSSSAPVNSFGFGSPYMRPMLEQIWLRDSMSQVKSDIFRLLRAKTYYEEAIKADPEMVVRYSVSLPQARPGPVPVQVVRKPAEDSSYGAETTQIQHSAGSEDFTGGSSKAPRNLHLEISKIIIRATHLLGELAERQQVYSQNRTERALDEFLFGRMLMYGKDGKEVGKILRNSGASAP